MSNAAENTVWNGATNTLGEKSDRPKSVTLAPCDIDVPPEQPRRSRASRVPPNVGSSSMARNTHNLNTPAADLLINDIGNVRRKEAVIR